MRYFDVHGHINFADYDADREEVIRRATEAGVSMIAVGTSLETSKSALEIAKIHDNVYAAIGLHPTEDEAPDLSVYRGLASNPKTVAIGECGLDYFHLGEESIERQRKTFISMIEIANAVDKPLMLHLRNPEAHANLSASESNLDGRSAYFDAYQILKEHAKVKGDLHFYAGTIEEAKPFLDLGYYFSFTGVITFARSYDEVIRYLPLNRIMSETDCPFVSPVSHRGRRNEPLYVLEVVKKIAAIRGEDEDKVAETLSDNARRFFA